MAYTDSSGGFRFRGLTGGVYYVEVDPAGTGYERQTQRVEAVPFSARGDAAGETFRVMFQLTPRKGAEGAAAEGPGVSFYQEVPEAARREFAQGRKGVESGDFEAASAALGRAVELNPRSPNTNMRLGMALAPDPAARRGDQGLQEGRRA